MAGRRSQSSGCGVIVLVVFALILFMGIGQWVLGDSVDEGAKLFVGFFIVLVIIGIIVSLWFYRTNKIKQKIREIEKEIQTIVNNELKNLISEKYDYKICPRCQENLWQLISVSPNGRSLEVQCSNCKRKTYFKAIDKDTSDVVRVWNKILEHANKAEKKAAAADIKVPISIELDVRDK